MYRYHTHSTSFRLTYPLPSPPGLWKHQDAVQFGVLTKDVHLHVSSMAACTAIAHALPWRGKASGAAIRTSRTAH
jgi:hypothetical protein